MLIKDRADTESKPALRLGQLVAGCLQRVSGPPHFYVEDEALLTYLEEVKEGEEV